jgi:hypothetical protein
MAGIEDILRHCATISDTLQKFYQMIQICIATDRHPRLGFLQRLEYN